ncbi:hypothetical protein M5689_011643 [Euphorbia peplus]|nr:hypothetical protein M5689_011643 [Euphorbia peplus]
MATGAAELLVQYVFDGSITMHDLEVHRRPYHKDCKCALHDLQATFSPNACSQHGTMSFPRKQSSTRSYSLSIAASKHSSPYADFLDKSREDTLKKAVPSRQKLREAKEMHTIN